MKKLFAVLMAMAMVVSMAACAAPCRDGSRSLADVEMKYMTADETEAVLGNTDYVIVDVRKAADYAEGLFPAPYPLTWTRRKRRHRCGRGRHESRLRW